MLTSEDIDMLQDSLDALEKAEYRDGMMEMMLGTMLAPNKEARDEMMAKHESDMASKKIKRQRLRERIVLLKAKLIQMNDSAEVDAIMAQTVPAKRN